MDRKIFKLHVRALSASITTLPRDSGSISAKRSLKSYGQQAKVRIVAKKSNLDEKSRKHKDMIFSSSKGKKPFSSTERYDEPGAFKDAFMELRPDRW